MGMVFSASRFVPRHTARSGGPQRADSPHSVAVLTVAGGEGQSGMLLAAERCMTVAPWTCPFCALACDHLGLRADGPALTLDGGDCPRARRGLAALAGAAGAAPAEVDGVPASVDEAIAAAAER